ncbi:MAG: hypothetical protein J6J17_02270 [Bacilli bacterium]|nr:hypothetical protein [Bacilli bacterium]
MKKLLNYLSFIPFAVCLGSLVIYIMYIIRIKINPSITVTEKITSMLRVYLLISLISLFIGLLIILVKKIYNLLRVDNVKVKRKKIKEINKDQKIWKNDDAFRVENISKSSFNLEQKEILKLDGSLCPECGGLISKNAAICTHCGILFDEELLRFLNNRDKINEKKVKKHNIKIVIANIVLIIVFIFLIFLISNMLLNKRAENNKNINQIVINK